MNSTMPKGPLKPGFDPGRMNVTRVLAGVALAAIAALSGCTTPPPPVVEQPPVVVIPPKPMPPMGAQDNLVVPVKDMNGERVTPNSGISTAQAVWNLRSAYNVAALNCVEAEYQPILDGYKRFLKVYARSLAKANKDVDASFRTQHSGRAAIKARETYQTQVYNFFSLPPAGNAFCRAAMNLTVELENVEPGAFDAWSFVGLAQMEKPFKDFYDSYEQYKADLAAWNARYGGGDITVRPTFEQQVEAQAAGPQVYAQ